MRIALVCEDDAHYFLATKLGDRVVLHEAEVRGAGWIDHESLEYLRSYEGLPGDERYCSMPRAKQIADELGSSVKVGSHPIKLRGFIAGRPLSPEAGFWRRVLMFFAAHASPPSLLLVVKDTDGDASRLDGLRQALTLIGDDLPVIVASPHQDAEAWFVAGFVPESDSELAHHAACIVELDFDPCEYPHRLTAHPNSAVTDAKRVLRRLLSGERRSRPLTRDEMEALEERTLRDLVRLERRGRGCLLKAFLDDLRRELVPLLIPGPPV